MEYRIKNKEKKREATRNLVIIINSLFFLLVTFIFMPLRVQAAISFIAEANDGCSTSDPASVNVPTGTADGDLMILTKTYMESTAVDIPNESGWIQIGTQNSDAGASDDVSPRTEIFYRIAASEPGSYSLDYPAAQAHCAAILTFRDARIQGLPYFTYNTGIITSGTTQTVTSIALDADLGAVVYLAANPEPVTFSSWAATIPSALTEVLEVSNAGAPDASMGAAWATVSSGSATGDATVTLSASSVNATGFLISLIEETASTDYTFEVTGTFTVPAVVTTVDVQAWAGGAGGGTAAAGGGGGGGAYSASTGLSVTPAENITVTVGSGGGAGSNGNDSHFRNTSTLLAKGGLTTANTNGGQGGSQAAGVGTAKFSGGTGGNTAGSNGGGGGGGAGSTGNGGNGSGSTAGTGTSVGGGNGGSGAIGLGANANPGSFAGGGGGGSSTEGADEAAGANGKVVIVLGAAGGGGTSSLSKPPNNLGLVGYWSFNEATSTIATDFSGNGKQGTLSTAGTGLPLWTSGRRAAALDFDGTDEYVAVGNVGSGIQTVSFWLKADDTTTRKVIDLNGTAQVELDGSSTVTATSFTSPTIYVDGSTASAVVDTEWHHVVVTTGTGINASATDLGRVSSGYFDGKIDEVRFYNRALGASEITALSRSGAARLAASSKTLTQNTTLGAANGLTGLWSFDGGEMNWTSATAGVAYDGSGNNLTGTLSNMNRTLTPSIGKLGQALDFDGSDDFVDVGNIGTVRSVAFWLKADDTTSREIINMDGSIQIELNGSSVVTATGFTSPTIYVDGVVASTVDTEWHHVVVTTGTNVAASTFQIGQAGASFFDGRVDDVRSYSRALTAAEAKQLYLLGQVKIVP
ncbi:MAG: LamG domain-containing protein [Minisyncoccia bacterium]